MNVHSPVRAVGPKPKPFPLLGRFPVLHRASQSCVAILAINWIFQAMRGMDGKELSFRLATSTAIAVVAAVTGARLGLDVHAATLGGWLIAHTFSFAINGQFWVCARYCRSYRRRPEALDRYVSTAVTRLQTTPWLDSALLIGSQGLGVGTRTNRSDIDLRLLFPSGIIGWLRCNALLLAWRTEALFRRIPLDLFAYDHAGSLGRFNQSEPLLEILDRAGRLRTRFPDRHWTCAT